MTYICCWIWKNIHMSFKPRNSECENMPYNIKRHVSTRIISRWWQRDELRCGTMWSHGTLFSFLLYVLKTQLSKLPFARRSIKVEVAVRKRSLCAVLMVQHIYSSYPVCLLVLQTSFAQALRNRHNKKLIFECRLEISSFDWFCIKLRLKSLFSEVMKDCKLVESVDWSKGHTKFTPEFWLSFRWKEGADTGCWTEMRCEGSATDWGIKPACSALDVWFGSCIIMVQLNIFWLPSNEMKFSRVSESLR